VPKSPRHGRSADEGAQIGIPLRSSGRIGESIVQLLFTSAFLLERHTNAVANRALQGAPVPKITAWFDSQHKLACEVTINLQIGDPSTAGAEGAQLVMTFTHYGVPVTVSAPAASDTVSLQQLMNAANH
jgi:hypothetical protein